ncbi:MAG: thioredoxin-disulfide reductase [Bacteroidota bacterium]
MEQHVETTKCLIIGSGPAGYTASIYAARAALKPILYQGLQAGGQLTITSAVDNFPGFPDGVEGTQLMDHMRRQAERFETDIRWGVITDVDFSKRPFIVKADDNKTILADSIIIATGATAKWLGLDSEKRLNGFGVSACAHCDGFFYKGLDVAVIGGGDTACEEATYLSQLCKKVYMVVRRDELRASKAMQKKVFETANIKVLFNHQTLDILGEQNVTGVLLKNSVTNEDVTIPVEGYFVAIGHTPNTEIFKGQIELDESGYIVTKPNSTQTSVPGIFAAGDVQDHVFRQAITAAGTGCMAAIELERYLNS